MPSVDNKRTGNVDLTFQLFYTGDEDFSISRDSDIEQDDTYGFGIGVAYNFNEHFALGFDFNFSEPDYQAEVFINPGDGGPPEPRTIKAEADIVTAQLKGIWHFQEGNFTPYAEAGAGWTYFDSNVSDGNSFLSCWFDPVFGYRCTRFSNTYDETNFSYGGGLGLRWEPTNKLLLKLSYSLLSVDFDGPGSDPLLQTIKFEIGSRY